MLPARSRLRHRGDFTAAVHAARGVRGDGLLVVHAARTTDGRTPRVGVVVTRAVGSAVTRNRVKRRLRHVLARRLAALPAGTDVVVRALPAAAVASSRRLAEALDVALRGAASRSAARPGAPVR